MLSFAGQRRQRRRDSASATRPVAAIATPATAPAAVMRRLLGVSGWTPSAAPARVNDSTNAATSAVSAQTGNATLRRHDRPGRARRLHAVATLTGSHAATAAAIAMPVPDRAWMIRNVG